MYQYQSDTSQFLNQYLQEIPEVAACGGSWICESPLIEAGDWEEIGRRTREALKALKADAL